MKLIECVPNISEGRNNDIINSITSDLKSNANIHLLDVDIGHDTNRTVITFIGEPHHVINAAIELICKSHNLIDMRTHTGAHPRMGATDVCPLIPVTNVSVTDCIEYSKVLAVKLSNRIDVPIYLYEKSAKDHNRSNLADIRSGEYEGFKDKINLKDWKPDYGSSKFNAKFGCIAIGCREFLLAYNINLNTSDKKIATDIALDIREKGRLKRNKSRAVIRNEQGIAKRVPGKFKHCKAVGWYIDEYNQAQVSINLTNYKKTPIHKVFEEVRKQARKRGVRVTGSEIVGLVPKKSIYDAGLFYLKMQKKQLGVPEKDIINAAILSLGLNDIYKFVLNDKIIEYKIISKSRFPNFSLSSFINEISRPTPTPGGGSVAALGASLGASLSAMVSNLSIQKKGLEEHIDFHNDRALKCQKNIAELISLIDKDSESYDKVLASHKMRAKTKEEKLLKTKNIEKTTIGAVNTPLKVLKLCNSVISDSLNIAKHCNPNSISDIAVAAEFLKAAAKGASYNVKINSNELSNKLQQDYEHKIDYHLKNIEDNYIKIINITNNILQKK